MTSPFQPTVALVACLLSAHGLRKRSLSLSGSLAALGVGYFMLSAPLRSFGITLIAFYLIGSRATKYGKTRKTQLEEGHEEAGHRTASQVLCNSFAALLAAAAWCALYAPESSAYAFSGLYLQQRGPVYDSHSWCALDREGNHGNSRRLVLAALGHFGCCLGDTLASELGILSRSRPILITTLKPVPPGTNGGVSAWGTLCSVAGGVCMGLTVAISILVENPPCRAGWVRMMVELIVLGGVAGGAGSMLDSLLGATVQRTRYSAKNRQILQDNSTEQKDVTIISGVNVLTNNQVNFVSSLVMAVVIGFGDW